MARNVAIGLQDFGKIISNQCFYVDKTDFIREWWESRDDVTLITRPRRFGKTLNMSMLEQFFSVHDPEEEKTLQDTVQEAHRQIQNRQDTPASDPGYPAGAYPLLWICLPGEKSADRLTGTASRSIP